ncbi:ABC transporter substrate-binding protein [Comamonas composti]|uniref:ABC transporter substrate-binding protein n=1 Tax=Comamonas composti TaxID=408558 RepID=UPI0004021E33|nr:helical backbone metal receptor [Comamonas composti]
MKLFKKCQAWVLAGALALGPTLAQAVQITDGRGVAVQLPRPPQRIVSLLPSLTESVCALGACERLVGVDRYSNWPEHIKSLKVVGGGLDPNIEAIVALKPDVVLVSMASRAVTRMEALGLKVVALEPRTHADARAVLQTLGQLLDLPAEQGADRVWGRIEAEIQKAALSVPQGLRGSKVYFEASRGPYAAGQTSFIGETLTRLGVGNIVGADLGSFPRINPEYVVRANPDFIMGGERSLGQSGLPYPGWASMRAVKAGRICRFKHEESDVLIRPGPRMAEGAWLMARCLSDKGQGLKQPGGVQ